jgi:putative ABC transport system permease protein
MSWTVLAAIGRKNLLGDRIRSTVALVGVIFASLLMLLQSAIYMGFILSASAVVDHTDADLWMAKAGTINFETAGPFDEEYVAYVRGVPGVAWAENVIYSFGNLRLPTGTSQWAHIVGFNPRTGVCGPWRMAVGSIESLTKPGTFIIDQTALAQFEGAAVGDKIENFGHRAEIVGLSSGSRTCTPNPIVYASLRTAQEQIPEFAGKTSFVVIKLCDGVDPRDVKERLARLGQFQVFTARELSGITQKYWATKTGIGIGIGVTICLGFIVGLVIMGQTMYSSTIAKLEEYATLKILGATNLQICVIIWYQAVLLAAVGYGVAIVLGHFVKESSRDQVITMHFSTPLLAAIGAATVVMCLGASLLSVQRILKVSPAAVFRV